MEATNEQKKYFGGFSRCIVKLFSGRDMVLPRLFGKIWTLKKWSLYKTSLPSGKGLYIKFRFFLITAFLFAYWLGPMPPLWRAAGTGALAGFGLVAACFGVCKSQVQNVANRRRLLHSSAHDFGVVLEFWH